MLILTRKVNEKILLGNNVKIMVVDIRGKEVKFGIEAPAGITVLRKKLAGKEKA